MFTLPHDDPGALCDVLVQFKENGINLTSISSRPANLQPWQYVFFVETVGKINSEVLKSIQKLCRDVAILGEFNRNWRFSQTPEKSKRLMYIQNIKIMKLNKIPNVSIHTHF